MKSLPETEGTGAGAYAAMWQDGIAAKDVEDIRNGKSGLLLTLSESPAKEVRGPQAPSTTSADTAAPQGADALPGGPAAEGQSTTTAAVPEAPLAPPRPVFISQEVDDLYSRYMTGETGHSPARVGDVMSALEALDSGLQDSFVTGTPMNDVERGTLRGALSTWADEYMAKQADATIGPARAPTDWVDPAQLNGEVRQMLYGLSRVVRDDPDALPLRGWEGTQYDFGPIPDSPSLPPRLIFEDYVSQLNGVLQGVGDEMLMKRKMSWELRHQNAMLRSSLLDRLPGMRQVASLVDTAVGGRDQRTVTHQAVQRFVDAIVGDQPKMTPEEFIIARRQAEGLIRVWDDYMSNEMTGYGRAGTARYRHRSAIEGDKLQTLADKHMFENGDPQWWKDFKDTAAKKGDLQPVATEWLKADNRVRNYFAGLDGGLAKMLIAHPIESAYSSRIGRNLSGAQRSLSVWYNVFRFASDFRWLGMNATESMFLTLSKEGLEPVLNAHGFFHDAKGQLHKGTQPTDIVTGRPMPGSLIEEARPYGFSSTDMENLRTNWPWLLQQAEAGVNLGRIRYVLANVKHLQDARLPEVIMEMARRDPVIAHALQNLGGTPREWLEELSKGWDVATGPWKGQRVLKPEEAAQQYQPLLNRGVISKAEYDQAVATGRYTPSPEMDRAITAVTNPAMLPLMERLSFLTDQFYNDATKLHFGQMDRSNLQRLLNHPLLYWPTSYMIKATKWLGNILFDRALGHDTGMAGAWTLAQAHQRHVELLATDPDYAKFFKDHETLFFIASMLLPTVPYGGGVALSPLTRMILGVGNELVNGVPNDRTRSVLDFGTQYSMEVLARALAEITNADPGSPIGTVTGALRHAVPVSFPVKPQSQSAQASYRASVGQVMDTTPQQPVPRQ